MVTCEPALDAPEFFGSEVTHGLEKFRIECDAIMASRWTDDLADVADKVYTRDGCTCDDLAVFDELSSNNKIAFVSRPMSEISCLCYGLPIPVTGGGSSTFSRAASPC